MTSKFPGASGPVLIPAPREALCLDYADTRYWRGSETPTESLHSLEDVLAWCSKSSALGSRNVDTVAAWWGDHPRQAAIAFEEAIVLREAIYRIFSTGAAGGAPSQSDVDELNGALARAPGRHRLHRVRGGYAWQVDRLKPDASHLLAPVLWSAGDLLVGPRLAKVRACANEKCQWLFLDDSKSGTRRWCSMSMCGNRAKAHRHYVRQKKG